MIDSGIVHIYCCFDTRACLCVFSKHFLTKVYCILYTQLHNHVFVLAFTDRKMLLVSYSHDCFTWILTEVPSHAHLSTELPRALFRPEHQKVYLGIYLFIEFNSTLLNSIILKCVPVFHIHLLGGVATATSIKILCAISFNSWGFRNKCTMF